VILLDPTGEGLKDSYSLASRKFRSLDGVRLGLLGNSKLNADKILDALGELIAERYAVETVFHRMKPSFSRPVPEDLKQEMLDHCDLIIAGVGD
jgi:hypothetical protein